MSKHSNSLSCSEHLSPPADTWEERQVGQSRRTESAVRRRARDGRNSSRNRTNEDDLGGETRTRCAVFSAPVRSSTVSTSLVGDGGFTTGSRCEKKNSAPNRKKINHQLVGKRKRAKRFQQLRLEAVLFQLDPVVGCNC